MNPYTRSLLRQLSDRRLRRFVATWDRLEAQIIQIYKSGIVTPEEEAEYQKTLRWLNKQYPHWQPALSKYGLQVRAGREPLEGDPFEIILSIQKVGDIPGNWQALRILPAAREALNQYLLDRIG